MIFLHREDSVPESAIDSIIAGNDHELFSSEDVVPFNASTSRAWKMARQRVLSRIAAKQVMRAYLLRCGHDADPRDLHVEHTHTRRPYATATHRTLREELKRADLSISHTEGCGLAGLVRAPYRIGVDIEPARKRILAIRSILSEKEWRALQGKGSQRAHLQAWTLKEAARKAGDATRLSWRDLEIRWRHDRAYVISPGRAPGWRSRLDESIRWCQAVVTYDARQKMI